MKKRVLIALICLLTSPAFGTTLSESFQNLLNCLDGLKIGTKGTSTTKNPIARVGNYIFVGGTSQNEPGFYVYGPDQSYFYKLPGLTHQGAKTTVDDFDKVHIMKISIPNEKSFIVRYKPSHRSGEVSTIEAIDAASADPVLAKNAVQPYEFKKVGTDVTDLKTAVFDKATRDQLGTAVSFGLFAMSEKYGFQQAGFKMGETVTRTQVFSAGNSCGDVSFPAVRQTIGHVFNAMNYHPDETIKVETDAAQIGAAPTH